MKLTLLPVLIVAALTAFPARGEEPRDLLTFLALSDAAQSAPAVPNPRIAAERRVRVDLGALAGNPRVQLLDGTVYETRRTGTERRGPDDFTWRGQLLSAGREVGEMTLTSVAGRTAATITLPSGLYQIEPGPGGEERLVEMDETALHYCNGGVSPHIDGGGLPRSIAGKAAAAASTVDVLVLYTHPVLLRMGSLDAVRVAAQTSIDMANSTYQNSQINLQVRLAALEELPSFTAEDDGDPGKELDALRVDPNVAALRAKFNADLVSLFVEKMDDACGIAYVMQKESVGLGFSAFAYSVVLSSCDFLTLAHEMGHNMGCAHDPDNAYLTPDQTSFPYSFGHGVDFEFYTVMAYPSVCPKGCPPIANFSNPGVLHNGIPTGIPNQRDNHRTIENTRALVADFSSAAAPAGPLPPCHSDSQTLCLQKNRFQARLVWQNQFDGIIGFGNALPRTDVAGFFTFDDPSNIELMLKILDFGDTIKVFYGELTDLHFTLTVTDTKTGKVNLYSNTPGDCGAVDPTAFPSATSGAAALKARAFFPAVSGAASSGSCKPGANTLCLGSGRFAVSVDWANPGNSTSGRGGAVPLSAVTGAFYFTDKSNLELLTKVLDFGDRIAFFYGTLSDLEYTLTVRDTVGGTVQSYHNAAGTFCGGLDNHAF